MTHAYRQGAKGASSDCASCKLCHSVVELREENSTWSMAGLFPLDGILDCKSTRRHLLHLSHLCSWCVTFMLLVPVLKIKVYFKGVNLFKHYLKNKITKCSYVAIILSFEFICHSLDDIRANVWPLLHGHLPLA